MDHIVISEKNDKKNLKTKTPTSGFLGIIFHTNWIKTCEKFI